MSRFVLALAGALCAMSTGTVFAQSNTSHTTALASAPGEVRSVSAAAATSYYYGYYLQPDRSYAAVCWNADAVAPTAPGVVTRCEATIRDGNDALVSAAPTTLAYFLEPLANGGSWATLTPSTAANYLVRARNVTTAGTVRVALVETTLFSPWFFVSAAAGYESYVEVKNTTAVPVSVRVRAFGASGAQVGAFADRTLDAGASALVTVGGNMGATGSGGLQITHNGPPGAVSANVTTLSGTTGLSFDAPFVARMVWSTFE